MYVCVCMCASWSVNSRLSVFACRPGGGAEWLVCTDGNKLSGWTPQTGSRCRTHSYTDLSVCLVGVCTEHSFIMFTDSFVEKSTNKQNCLFQSIKSFPFCAELLNFACACATLQRVTCGTWALWRWSRWRDIRRFRRRPPWRSPWTPRRLPPSSTLKCRHRGSPSPTTRGSECSHTTDTDTDVMSQDATRWHRLSSRRLFFRRHYAVNTVIFCSLDPQGRKWVMNCTHAGVISLCTV